MHVRIARQIASGLYESKYIPLTKIKSELTLSNPIYS